MVQRIMGAGLPPEEVLNLPSKPVLKWACEVLGCKVSGTKEELQTRVTEKLLQQQGTEEKSVPKKRPAKQKKEAGDESPEKTVKPKAIPPPPPASLIDTIFDILKTIYIDYHGISDEDSLAASIATVLMNNAQLHTFGAKINRASTSQRDNKKQPDIVITKGDNERVFVESKYINQTHPTKSIGEAKEQFFNFAAEFGSNSGLFFFYDRDSKMPRQDIESFNKLGQGKVIYKTLDDSNL